MSAPNPEKDRWYAEEVHPHASSLRSYLRGAFPAIRDVDDVVQESLLRLWRARAGQQIRSARAFLFQVGRHLALDLVRRDRRSPIAAEAEESARAVAEPQADAAEAACTSHDLMILAQAIERLPARCREIFILRKLQGVPQKEIAARLGLSEQTVQVQAARGLKRCEKYLRLKGVRGGPAA